MYNFLTAAMAESSSEAALAGISGAITLISLLLSVFMIVCQWKLFQKFGENGWAAIVPFYNHFVFFKCGMGNGWMMFLTMIPLVGVIFQTIAQWKLFTRLGKSTGFNVLGIFFPPVAQAIAAFDSSSVIA